ncbi:hypothetical protein RN347_05285 [Halomonas sp. PAMB 3264]|uniref:hypothetical protein n=1 Tax=Halomonas sp. PAMB 3264 TaxID=3075222 RepID=UPI00289FFCE8|nr:hypothetical protein [Halomonas sp. PAMB 3264]WNL43319.1 hypothetical protein RN347_05285 [Halomonas sp. PAMB 3264]
MGKLLSLIGVLALGYAGVYVYYGHAVEREVEQALSERGLSNVTVESVDYGLWAPISTSTEITLNVAYRGSQAALNLGVEGHPLFSDEVAITLDGLQALRLGLNF